MAATTYKNSLRLCFLRYFLVKYLRYLLEKLISALTVILLSSLFTFTFSPRWPVLPAILMRLLKNSAKLVVLKTLSSTGFEQSMLNEWDTLTSACYFLASLALGSLVRVGWAYFVVILKIIDLIILKLHSIYSINRISRFLVVELGKWLHISIRRNNRKLKWTNWGIKDLFAVKITFILYVKCT